MDYLEETSEMLEIKMFDKSIDGITWVKTTSLAALGRENINSIKETEMNTNQQKQEQHSLPVAAIGKETAKLAKLPNMKMFKRNYFFSLLVVLVYN